MFDKLKQLDRPVKWAILGAVFGLIGATISDLLGLTPFSSGVLGTVIAGAIGGYVGGYIRKRRDMRS
ncbi:MAG: hypothetical protein GY792_11070 [Gammaproteobacteria bacterium]|nr:hypothetical protein [Gammaproteobacteria bacterium]